MNNLLIVLSLLLFKSCTNPNQNKQDELLGNLKNYSKIIESRNLNKISKICAPRGLDKLLEWSDSLKNNELLNSISNTFSSNKIVFIQVNSETFNLQIEPTKVKKNSDPTGSITLIIQNGKFKIDDYKGGFFIRLE